MKRDRPQSLILELLAERTVRTVLRIADDRVPARCALDANLVRAAGLKFHFKPRARTFDPTENTVTHDRQFPARIPFGHHDRLRHPMPLVQVIGPPAFLRLNVAFDYRPVHFRDRSIFELRRQPLRGADVPSENDRPRYRAVEPMGQPEIDVAFL